MKRSSKTPHPLSARLFSESHTAGPPAGVHIANIDGASRGNPGPASYAVVIRDPNGKTILELSKHIGRETNNVAEYYALLAALDYATSHNISALRIRSDSELLVRQMQGRYKVKSVDLKPLHERASKMAKQLGYFAIEHVRRELNRDADALANVALDQAGVPKFTGTGSTASESRANSLSTQASVSTTAGSSPQVETQRIRARFANGVLVPIEPLDLPEGAEVAIEFRSVRGGKP
jgi:ribonuclease HI